MCYFVFWALQPTLHTKTKKVLDRHLHCCISVDVVVVVLGGVAA